METKDIQITGVQDGALAYVQRDGSDCGLLDSAILGHQKIKPAPDGGLFIEDVDGNGCGRVFPGEVENFLTSTQKRLIDQLPQ